MSTLQAALYARVSSEQQAEANTIASQVTAEFCVRQLRCPTVKNVRG
jgi:hypothetical protein